MKKHRTMWRILCVIIAILYFSICVQATQIQNNSEQDTVFQEEENIGIDATTTLLGVEKLVDNVQSAVLFEANSNTLMYTWKADAKMRPASFVKILTALIAVEEGNLSDVVTVSESAVSSVPHGAVSADLQAGEQLTLEDLLYCMMVGSANDAAAVIAEHLSGGQAAFVQKMNDYAQGIGCTNTQFTNPHGLHDDQQFTTARDAARILAAAVKNEAFFTIFTAKQHTVAATNKSDLRSMQTGNFLVDPTSKLYYDARVLGGRTGVTEDGKRCLASVADHNGMRLICVVMGTESEYQEDGYSAISIGGYKETTALLDAGSNGFKTAQIIYENQALRQITVASGDSDVIVGPQTSVITILPENVSSENLTFRYSDLPLQAPVQAGQKVSHLQVWNGNMCVAQADLYAMNSVGQINDLLVLQNSGNGNRIVTTILLVAVCIACVAFVALFAVRGVGKLKMFIANRRKNRYHRSHRRSR